jgi:hypothetical protein
MSTIGAMIGAQGDLVLLPPARLSFKETHIHTHSHTHTHTYTHTYTHTHTHTHTHIQVRQLKADKASKDDITAAVERLKVLKIQLEEETVAGNADKEVHTLLCLLCLYGRCSRTFPAIF